MTAREVRLVVALGAIEPAQFSPPDNRFLGQIAANPEAPLRAADLSRLKALAEKHRVPS